MKIEICKLFESRKETMERERGEGRRTRGGMDRAKGKKRGLGRW